MVGYTGQVYQLVGWEKVRGEFPTVRPSHSIQLSPVWFNGGVLGGRLGGWVVGGKVGETMCHVSIACIHHSTLTYPILGESLVQIWENLLGVLPMGGNHGVVYRICVVNWPRGSNT